MDSLFIRVECERKCGYNIYQNGIS